MCGIAGHLNPHDPPNPALVEAMSEALRHRGPDDEGLWVSPDRTCVLGHRRLSIIDLSQGGHQPMVDPLTGNAIVFNGEIYNFKALRADCEMRGDRFTSESDTEVILALYRRFGHSFLTKLTGMFALALWDNNKDQLILARDRAGEKPLYYSVQGRAIIFASELRALASHPSISTTVSSDSLEFFFHLEYIPQPNTIYSEISKLPAAHYAVFDKSGMSIRPYWEVDYREKIKISEEDAVEQFEELLLESVRLRVISDVPLGALLSGGVDSSVIVALMSRISGTPIRTFSIGFNEKLADELPFSDEVARICGTEHTRHVHTDDVAESLPLIARQYGEPFADPSAVPSFAVYKIAREHVTVALNGDGGDELLAGYGRHRLSDLHLQAARRCPALFAPETLAGFAGRFMGASLVDRGMRRAMEAGPWPELRSTTMYGGYFGDKDRRALLAGFPPTSAVQDWRAKWFGGAYAHANNPIDRMLWQESQTYLADDLLVKADIASMHVGLEARAPFLDHNLVEYCASLPISLKVKGGVGKYLLKKVASKYFPERIVGRKKQGFSAPILQWLTASLRELVEDICGSPAGLELLDPAMVRRTVEAFYVRKQHYLAPRVWLLLMYGLWRKESASP